MPKTSGGLPIWSLKSAWDRWGFPVSEVLVQETCCNWHPQHVSGRCGKRELHCPKKLFLPSLWSTGGGEALIIPAFPLSVAAKQKDPWPSWHATMLSKLLLLLCFSKSHRAVHGEHRKKGNWWEVYIGLGERNDINFSYWVHITCQKLECNIHVPSKPVLNKLGLLLSQLCLGCLLNAWTL